MQTLLLLLFQLMAAEKRPKYMETRDLSYFKDMLLLALDEVSLKSYQFVGIHEVSIYHIW